MDTSFADFAEQINPKTLAEARLANFRQATRVHGSFLAAAEKRALVWVAERMPAWVNSDHLTILGFAAQIATGVCYALAVHDRRMRLAAIVCLAVNWGRAALGWEDGASAPTWFGESEAASWARLFGGYAAIKPEL
jgi:hypothetical protein